MTHVNSKKYQGYPLPPPPPTPPSPHTLMIERNLGKIWKTHPARCPNNTFPEVFQIKLSILHLIPNGLNGVSINLLTWIVALL